MWQMIAFPLIETAAPKGFLDMLPPGMLQAAMVTAGVLFGLYWLMKRIMV